MWLEPSPAETPESLRAAVGGHPLVAELLARRGLTDPVTALGFLDPERYTPAPPPALPDLELAARALYDAVLRRRRILVWGDFDVDGQTATALLVSMLRDLGAHVAYYVPQRLTESHGIRVGSLDRLLGAQHVDVLLTCDTGIAEHEAIAHAKARGLTVLVTDHHDLPPTLPAADALVNPKRLPAGHSLRDLPGVGVAFKLAQQVQYLAGDVRGDSSHRPSASGDASYKATSYIDLVALGIVADVARQAGDTRYLLQLGLDRLRRPQRLGLQVLMQFAKLDPANLSAEHIGFALGPRLNAIGRLGDAALAVELLTTTDLTRARIIASQIEGLNNQRRNLTEQVYAAAQEQIARDPSLLDGAALVLSSPHWHPGVIGPVASRLAEKYIRPTVLLVTSEQGLARGSARSAPGVDISAALHSIRDRLTGFGGHPGAAGLSLRADDISIFRRALSRAVDAIRDRAAAPAGTSIDAFVSLDELTLELAQQIERLAPFGEGNPPVTLAVRDVTIADARTFGRRGEHRQVTIEDGQGVARQIVWWRGADEDLPEGRLDLALTIKGTDYRGAQALSIEWIAARVIEAAPIEVAAPSIETIDWRRITDVANRVQALAAHGDVMVWADGDLPSNVPARRRTELAPAGALVIWRAPVGPKELEAALMQVSPKTVCLCDEDGIDDRLDAFTKRLAGLLKHDLNRREGRVDVSRLAVAAGQRPATVRKGIEWLAAKGQIAIVEGDGDELRIGAGEGAPDANAEEIGLQLAALLAETAAYRAYYRRADAQKLIVRE
ncbi:MAG: single-stranded-DNA-specific exonuclease RecJ [Anaerolineae bacterium]